MIDHDSAVKLVASFSALPYFHTVTKEGLAVMVQTVERFVHDAAHAKRVQDDLIFSSRVPSPGEIRDAALATAPKDEDFHHEPLTPEEIAENAKWADELAQQLSAGKSL